MSNTISWMNHNFTVYNHAAQWNKIAGIYIFAGLNQVRQWVPYYVGQTDNFQDRIPSHEKWEKAQSLGATHVHVLVVQQESQRDNLEKQLIQAFRPSLNVQHAGGMGLSSVGRQSNFPPQVGMGAVRKDVFRS